MAATFTWRSNGWRAAGAMLAAALMLQACGSDDSGDPATEEEPETVSWTHGILHPGPEAGFLLMAREKGLFEKYGVEVEYVEFSSGTQIFPALIAGEVDSIEASPGALYPAAQQGQDVRVVGSTMPSLPYALYASGEIGSVQDLEGKSIAISAPNALPAQVAMAILKEEGVDADSIEWLNGGSNADRYRAVVTGTADAASSPADFIPQAEQDGLNVLALSTDVVPRFPRYTVTANGSALEERPEGMVRFLAAMAEGIQYALDHPDEAAELSAKTLDTTPDDPMIEYMTELIVSQELVSPEVRVPTEEMEYLEGVLMDIGELQADVDIESLIDESFREEALELVEQQAE